MSFHALLGWSIGLWIAAGIESACGTGTPGPLLLIAIAAGFSTGSLPGSLIGALAGLCSAALGSPLVLGVLIGVACGLAASLCARHFSRRNLLVVMLMAALFSVMIGVLLGLGSGQAFFTLFKHALWCGFLNALWIFPIYGIVLVVSPRHSSESGRCERWE